MKFKYEIIVFFLLIWITTYSIFEIEGWIKWAVWWSSLFITAVCMESVISKGDL